MTKHQVAVWVIYAGSVIAAVELAGHLADLFDAPLKEGGVRTVGDILFIPVSALLMLASWHMLRGVFRTKG